MCVTPAWPNPGISRRQRSTIWKTCSRACIDSRVSSSSSSGLPAAGTMLCGTWFAPERR